MILNLNHKNLDLYEYSGTLIVEIYRITLRFPEDERFSLVQQLRRAAVSIRLNISEGASRKSATERKRFYEIARSSLVEVDAVLEIATRLEYLADKDLTTAAEYIVKCFKILSAMTRN